MKKHLKNFITFFITIVFTLLVINQVDFWQTIEAFKLFNIKYLFILVPVFFGIMLLRTYRWDILLQKTGVKIYDIFEIYIVSNLLNIFLPARAGDIFRGCYFGHKFGLSKLKILGSVAAERILDGLTVVLILLLGIILHENSLFIIRIAFMASIIFIFSFLFIFFIYKNNKCDYVCNCIKEYASNFSNSFGQSLYKITDSIQPLLNSFIRGFEAFAEPKILTKVFILSILSWVADCCFMYCLVLAFGFKVHFAISLFIVSFTALSTIIPSSSIYVGLYQYAFMLAVGLFDITNSTALSIALVQQGIVLFAYAIIGVFFVIKNRIKLLKYKEKEVD